MLAALGTGGSILTLAFALFFYFDADRLRANDKSFLDLTRARLCAIHAAENREEPRPQQTVSGPLTIVGWFALDNDAISHEEPGGNMDKIQTEELSFLCEGAARPRDLVLYSLFVPLAEPRSVGFSRDSYAAVKRALAAMKRVEYVVVLRVSDFRDSVSTGSGTMARGRYAGRATIYRLSDGAFVDRVEVAAAAPGVAFVTGRRLASGGVSESDVDSNLAASTKLAFENAIANAFRERGIVIKPY